jgi:hypothetical protein
MKLSQAIGLTDATRHADSAEIVVLHTGRDLTPQALQAAANLTKGLNFSVILLAVHIVPYPLQLETLAIMQAHLEAELGKASEGSVLPVSARIAFARDLSEAFHQCVRPESLVVIGARKRWWRTRPERWARELARNGFRTALVQL